MCDDINGDNGDMVNEIYGAGVKRGRSDLVPAVSPAGNGFTSLVSNNGVTSGKIDNDSQAPPAKRAQRPKRIIQPMDLDEEGPINGAATSTGAVQNGGIPKKVVKRSKPRKLPVPVSEVHIWDVLGRINAGLSVSDWLAMDKDAARDLADGLRDLSSKRPQRSKRHMLNRESRIKAMQNVGIGVVNAVDQDGDDEGADSYSGGEEDSEYYSEADSIGYDIEESTDGVSIGTIDSVYVTDDGGESDLDDAVSIYRYPYDLDRMRASSPMRGVVKINGHPIEAIFDTGASVSVIGSHWVKKLSLVPNGDTLQLVGFDNKKASVKSNVVMDVPVEVGGMLRPEHMCVQEHPENSRLCLLGVTWFKAYGIEIDLINATIKVPSTRGAIKLKCYTSHVSGDLVQRNDARLLPVTTGGMSLNERFVRVNQEAARRKTESSKQIFMVESSQKYTETYTEDLIPQAIQDDSLICQQVKKNDVIYDEDNIAVGVPDVLAGVVQKYKHCFSEVSGLTRIKDFQMNILLKEDAQPVRSKPFRISWEDEDALNEYIDEMLSLNLISKSDGVWTSSCFMVPKKDGSKRCVIDYRRLNKLIVPTNFPGCTVAELTEATADATVFTSCDCASGYHQLEINPEHANYTGFICKRGVFKFNVLPMGISIGCWEYNRVVSEIFKEYIGKFILVFLDDVLCFSRNMEEHERHLELMFQACEKYNLKLKRKKCFFGQDSVEYLGHRIGKQGSHPGERNVEKIKNFPSCTDVSSVKSFLGMTGFFRKYIRGYSEIVACLTKLTRKGVPFIWGDEQETAFLTLKKALCTAPILVFPDRNKVQVLSCDASNLALGAILSQVDSWDTMANERVIAYASRGLRGPERNYHIHHLEALAVVWSINYFSHYLKGRRFLLITDHSSLVYIFKPSKNTAKLSRWCAAVMEYSFDIIFRPGKRNIADSLSRTIVPVEKFKKSLDDESPIIVV